MCTCEYVNDMCKKEYVNNMSISENRFMKCEQINIYIYNLLSHRINDRIITEDGKNKYKQ